MKKGIKAAIFGVLLVAALVIFGSSIVMTYPNEYKLIRQFGKVVAIKESPGLSFKVPFVQDVQSIPRDIQIYDLAVSDVITKDKKTMVADCFALWRVTDPIAFVSSLSGQVEGAEARINTLVYNSLKNVISSMSQSDVISGRDGKLAEAIRTNVGATLEQYGIELMAVETKRLDLPDDNKNAVYERMISERENIAASYKAEGEAEATKIHNQTDTEIRVMLSAAEAEAERIKGEGEAEYMRILSEAYSDQEKADFYTYVRALDAAKASLTGENKTLILDKNSPLAQIFYGQ